MYCTTELCLSVDKRAKDNKQGTTMLVYNVYVKYILSRVGNWEYLHPCSTADACLKLSVVIISQLLSFVPFALSTFVPTSAISKYCGDGELVSGVHTLVGGVVQVYHRLQVLEEEEKGRKVEQEVEREDQGEENTRMTMHMEMV